MSTTERLQLAEREIKLLRAALDCKSPYACAGSIQKRRRLEELAERCRERREGTQ